MHDPITIALEEDLGSGDLTSRFFVPAEAQLKARIFAKQTAVAAGVEVAAEVFRRVDPTLSVSEVRTSGTSVESGDTLLMIEGAAQSIVTAERVALNFIQRLSGVATLTRRYVDAVAGTGVRILDTRKTLSCQFSGGSAVPSKPPRCLGSPLGRVV